MTEALPALILFVVSMIVSALVFAASARMYGRAVKAHRRAGDNYQESIDHLDRVRATFPLPSSAPAVGSTPEGQTP